MPETPESALKILLHDLFDADEFRVFLGRLGAGSNLHAALVGKVATTELLFSEAVRALKRRGEVDEAFFRALVKERPKKKADIVRVASMWVDGFSVSRTPDELDRRLDAVPVNDGVKLLRENHGDVKVQGGESRQSLSAASHPPPVEADSPPAPSDLIPTTGSADPQAKEEKLPLIYRGFRLVVSLLLYPLYYAGVFGSLIYPTFQGSPPLPGWISA